MSLSVAFRAAARAARARGFASAPAFYTDATVLDEAVRVTFIDYMGGRHEVLGRAGQTLVQVAAMHARTAELLLRARLPSTPGR